MNPVPNASPSFRWALRYIEWILLTVSFLLQAIDGAFSYSPEISLQLCAFVVAFAGLSWFFPIDRPLWERQGYLFLGILLGICNYALGLRFGVMLYVYIAKSCFLLNWKNVVLLTTITGIVNVMTYSWRIPKILQMAHSYRIDLFAPKQITLTFLENYLLSSSFVILFCFVAVAEQKSRRRAEALAQQVETLAATLERTRLAREIHDSLGHTLTALNT